LYREKSGGEVTGGIVLELAKKHAAGIGIAPPRFTVYEGKPVLISALPTGRGDEALPSAENPAGSIAAFAQKNFYRELAERLKTLLRMIGEASGEKQTGARIFCNSRLPEKRLAVQSGLGVQGKNSLVIIPGAGSLFVLGGIVFPEGALLRGETEAPPPAGRGGCDGCDASLRACPTRAIGENGRVDRELCIQAYTAEERPVPPRIREKWGITLYGCPVCQQVCPHNREAPQAADTIHGCLGPSFPLERILACDLSEIRKRLFKGSVLDRAWISPAALKRNALFAAARQKAVCLLPLIRACALGEHPLVREAAEWAWIFIQR
jgi:epoxyqueuosine reductase